MPPRNVRTTHPALKSAVAFLSTCGIEHAEPDALLLMAHATKLTREQLLINDHPLDDAAHGFFNRMVARRGQNREPLAYIVAEAGFRDLMLEVTPSVLIPRPSTETLVELALKSSAQSAADIGTGSGAIAIAVARGKPDLKVIATDVSIKALTVASRNAEKYQVADRIEFRQGSLFDPLSKKVDLLLSNPPYIPHDVIESLEPEVKQEPDFALNGGPDGLDFLRMLIANAGKHLNKDGTAFFEFGQGQEGEVQQLTKSAGHSKIQIHRDLDGIDRILQFSV